MNKIIFFSDFAVNHTNRGCQALTYGGLYFIKHKFNTNDAKIISPSYYIRRKRKDEIHHVVLGKDNIEITKRYYWLPEIILSCLLIKILGDRFKVGRFAKDIQKLKYAFNISGGDGFSDIYSSKTFMVLLWPSLVTAFLNKHLILLPQTIGPFYRYSNRLLAEYAIRKAKQVFVRDEVYVKELIRLNVRFSITNDVSYYMEPQKVNIDIPQNAIGINISGLAYFNSYKNLTGKFLYYKDLLIDIIEMFQSKNIPIFLIPHTYDHKIPEINADDLQASKDLVKLLKHKSNITIIDEDFIAPELKYIISKMDFFAGTRLHSNFAAIYSEVPVFGLSYSYKFSGSFDRYGLNDHYSSVTDIKKEDILQIIKKIEFSYENRDKIRKQLQSFFKDQNISSSL